MFLCVFNQLSGQEVWRESFTIPGKGIWGEQGEILSDFTDVDSWFLEFDVENLNLADENDYAKTVSTSGGRFEIRDVDGEVAWFSQPVIISGFEKIDVELVAAETGSGDNKETKYLKAFYRLDGGDEMPFTENGENLGNWGSSQASVKGLSGFSLQVVCRISNHYASDRVILDEVVVSAQEKVYPPARPGEIILTEILFNPYTDGEDYVEIYNNSDHDIPLGKLFLASRDKELNLEQICGLAGKIHLIPPKTYVAVTKDTSAVFPFYWVKCAGCFQQVARIPSFNNDDDYVALLNENHEILDELSYSEKMHSPFLADVEGVSLERVSVGVPAGTKGNWHSASSDAGYGTPGYENSQAGTESSGKPKVIFEPEAFSPNLDNYNDEFFIRYETAKPGFVANITVFDVEGRFVHHLARNEILGTSGEFLWNGEDETGSRQPLGVYVVMVEIFNAEGEVHRFKEGVVLTDVFK